MVLPLTTYLGPQLARSGPLCLVTFCLPEVRPFPPLPPPAHPCAHFVQGLVSAFAFSRLPGPSACQARASVLKSSNLINTSNRRWCDSILQLAIFNPRGLLVHWPRMICKWVRPGRRSRSSSRSRCLIRSLLLLARGRRRATCLWRWTSKHVLD